MLSTTYYFRKTGPQLQHIDFKQIRIPDAKIPQSGRVLTIQVALLRQANELFRLLEHERLECLRCR